MKVIARNNGPLNDLRIREGLIEGKEYDEVRWSYQDHNIKPGYWVTRTDDFINPKEPRFFINVINENGREGDYWNDYFLSSEEVRDMKLWHLFLEKDLGIMLFQDTITKDWFSFKKVQKIKKLITIHIDVSIIRTKKLIFTFIKTKSILLSKYNIHILHLDLKNC